MERKFSLAALLRLRTLQETKAAGELAAANHAVRRSTGQRSAALQKLAEQQNAPADATTLLAVAAARASTSARLVELQALLEGERRHAARATAEHQQARRELKSLQKLAERDAAQRRRAELANEQHQLDDLPAARGHGGGQR